MYSLKDLTAKVFGFSFTLRSKKFVELKNTKNPYLIGRWLEDNGRFDIYVGKDGIKMVPYKKDVFIELVFSIDADDEGEGVYTDGNQRGFCIVYVCNGGIKELFLFRRASTSNQNELEGVKLALKMFPFITIYSDSLYAVRKVNLRRVKKVDSHSGILWNSIPDYILKNL